MAEYLRSYLRETRKSSDGTFVFGVNDFHSVRETMLRETILRSPHDRKRNWNSELPKPVYVNKGSGEDNPRSRGMQTDIILENKFNYTIVDAKYYAAKSAESAPGWPDIAKQMFYEKALREIIDAPDKPPSLIRNIFVFLASKNDGPLTEVELRHRDGKPVRASFPAITCSYVSIREVLINYVSYSQGIELRSEG